MFAKGHDPITVLLGDTGRYVQGKGDEEQSENGGEGDGERRKWRMRGSTEREGASLMLQKWRTNKNKAVGTEQTCGFVLLDVFLYTSTSMFNANINNKHETKSQRPLQDILPIPDKETNNTR